MIASCNGVPSRSTGTVPDHCEVTDTATMSSTRTAEPTRASSRCVPATMPAHQSDGRCSAPPPGDSNSSTGSNSPSTNSPVGVNSATFRPDVPRSIVKMNSDCSGIPAHGAFGAGPLGPRLPHVGSASALTLRHRSAAGRPAHPVAEEAALGAGVRVVVVGNVPHVVVDVVVVREVLGDDERELLVHVRELRRGRLGAVAPPHDHRRRTDLALGDPADV